MNKCAIHSAECLTQYKVIAYYNRGIMISKTLLLNNGLINRGKWFQKGRTKPKHALPSWNNYNETTLIKRVRHWHRTVIIWFENKRQNTGTYTSPKKIYA